MHRFVCHQNCSLCHYRRGCRCYFGCLLRVRIQKQKYKTVLSTVVVPAYRLNLSGTAVDAFSIDCCAAVKDRPSVSRRRTQEGKNQQIAGDIILTYDP